MRRSTLLRIIVAVVLIGIVAVVIALTSGSTSTGNNTGLGQFAVPPGTTDSRPLGEIYPTDIPGAGSCWPGDERPSGGKAAGFATSDGPAKAADWLRKNPAAAERLDRHLNAHAGYYLITEVVPEWHKLSPVERTAQYVSKMKAVKMTTMIRVLNTYCKDNNVVAWEVQVLPVDEWVFFIPGHEPGSADPRPAFKGVCGNPLLPPPPPAPQQPQPQPAQPTTPGHSECKACTTTPPPPPPGCKKPCLDQKNSSEAPGQGGAGDGGKSKYGGDGDERHHVDGPASGPAAGDPPADPPAAQQPAPEPVPGGQPAPQEPVQPPATGAPPASAAPTTTPCAPGRC